MRRRGRPPYPDVLTPREWEVLALLREGLSNEEIAERLGVSLAGAKYHVSEILGKLGVSSREEAAAWQPAARPWWAVAAAPAVFVGRRLSNASWLAPAAGGAVVIAAAAGIGLLVWGLVRTNGDGEAGAALGPLAIAADIRECLHPVTFAENRQSVNDIDPDTPSTAVTVGGRSVDEQTSRALLPSLRDAEPAVFGVRATTARIGEPGRTSGTVILVSFGARSLELRYVQPGNVAPYGLLFDPATVDTWEHVGLLIPAGYAQLVCTVPPEFETLMATLGFPGYEPEGILETRLVPLKEAQRDIQVDRIEVWKEGRLPQTLPGLSPYMTEDPGASQPVPPFTGEPLTLQVWYAGVDPFPEAVRPAVYRYYPTDGGGSQRGVLVLLEPGAVANGTLGNANTPPTFASAELDELLGEAGLTTGDR